MDGSDVERGLEEPVAGVHVDAGGAYEEAEDGPLVLARRFVDGLAQRDELHEQWFVEGRSAG